MASTDPKPGGDVRRLQIKRPTLAQDARFVEAHYDTWTEWREDPAGYWLFRVNKAERRIEAGFCKAGNVIEVVVTGRDSEAMYNTIIRQGLVKSLQHAAYIGHELQKAEVALKLRIPYVQDLPLRLERMKVVEVGERPQAKEPRARKRGGRLGKALRAKKRGRERKPV